MSIRPKITDAIMKLFPQNREMQRFLMDIGGLASDTSTIEQRLNIIQEVVDISNPTEISLLTGNLTGSILIAYEAEVFTVYAYTSEVLVEDIPYIVAGSSGFWVAVGGAYIGSALRILGALHLDGYATDGFLKIASSAVSVDTKTYVPGIPGTEQGQLFFWDNALSQLVPCETSERFWDDVNKRVGIKQAAPTALLHIGAGTAVAGTGPFKLTEGTLTTIAESGLFEFLNDILYFTIPTGPTRKKIAYADTDYGGMYTYDQAVSLNITSSSYYSAIHAVAAGDILPGLLSGWTFNAGRNVDANITSEANTGGLLRIINSGVHNLTAGDIVVVNNANNAAHNGATRISVDATNPTTEFICDDIPYVAGAGASAAEIDEPAYLEITFAVSQIFHIQWSVTGESAVANKVYRFEPVHNITHIDRAVSEDTFSNTTPKSVHGHGLISANTGDRVWMQCKNITDSTNFMMKHFNMTLSRQ